ncbi:hypothetical protein ACQEVF_19280 [Nonomuraea polychroma]|uniref:hypothetical protein n=1 Tax=Nonomuraea polychroma TaxID=46176 RepID=UPI003D919E4A
MKFPAGARHTSVDLGVEVRELDYNIRASGIPYTVLRNGSYNENDRIKLAAQIGVFTVAARSWRAWPAPDL